MLEKLPHAIGHLLAGAHPGIEKTVYHDDRLAAVPPSIVVTSLAFADGAPLPLRFTGDGAGVSPPLAWSGVPDTARSVVIVVEDPDAPAPSPLVHLIVHGLGGGDGSLAEGAASDDPPPVPTGTTSFFGTAWLPPDPPPGGGDHRYVFQIFALGRDPDFGEHPRRGAIVDVLDLAVAKGVLIGTYGRP